MLVKKRILPSQERLRYLLDYDPATGFLRTKEARGGYFAGDRIGGVSKRGYRRVSVDGVLYQEANVIWKWMTGEDPIRHVDHRDCDKQNNKWGNLRLATFAQNIANQPARRTNKLGVKGVSRYRRRFRAHITVDGRNTLLGTFDSVREASAAYGAAAVRIYGEFARAA